MTDQPVDLDRDDTWGEGEQPDPFPSEEPGEDYAGDTAEEVVRPEDNEPAADPEEG